MLDVAGGTGGLTFEVLEVHLHLRATLVDLPTMTPLRQRYVEEAGVADRVRVTAAVVVNASLEGSFDVAVLKSFIQVLTPEQACRALGTVSRVIEPGGDSYILGSIPDDSRLSPPQAVASNLNFLNIYDGGQAYTEQEYRDRLSDPGFEGFERVLLSNGTSIVWAQKAASNS